MDEKQQLAHKVAQLIQVLPPMPDNIARLMTSDVESPAQHSQLLRLIEKDPGLCTDLLHLANDLCYASGQTVETIDDALQRIGIRPLVQLIGVWFTNQTIRKELAMLEHLSDYFQHSRDISLSCRILAELCRLPQHECEMFAVAGLIHDIGRLIIMVASNRLTVHLMGTSWDKMLSIVNDEKDILGLNHCDVGMQLCNKWNFSSVLQQGVLRHHTPLVDSDFSFPGALIFVSHFVSYSDLTGEILSTMLGTELLDCLHLTQADFADSRRIYQSRSASSPKSLKTSK